MRSLQTPMGQRDDYELWVLEQESAHACVRRFGAIERASPDALAMLVIRMLSLAFGIVSPYHIRQQRAGN